MDIAFRVDASAQIATGHFMRCLALADALRQRGARIRFISRHLPAPLPAMLRDHGHGYASIDGVVSGPLSGDLPHAHWLGATQQQDAADTIAALADSSWDWVVVDHYALDAHWETALRRCVRRIAVIDDLADRGHDCDLLIDQNFHPEGPERYRGRVPESCVLLLGPRYALLRQEFASARRGVIPRHGRIERILVFFGGVDSANHTGQAIEALSALEVAIPRVDVVIGAGHAFAAEIAAQCRQSGFTCHVQTTRMAELIAAADLALGAGGTAIWERCCLGLPALALCAADNQAEQIASAAAAGLLYAPESSERCSIVIQRHLEALIDNSNLRHAISQAGMREVDGLGVWRVADDLGLGDIQVRIATEDDARKVFEWRNEPRVRASSRSSDVIDWETHRAWFAAALSSTARILLIGERGNAPVGVVRFDIEDALAEVSIYLVSDPIARGQGRGLLLCAERWLSANRPTVTEVRAQVLGGNVASERLFLGAGYRTESTRYSKRLLPR